MKRILFLILPLLLCLPGLSDARDRSRPTQVDARVFGGAAWTPASPTKGGVSPEHWYKADAGTYQAAAGAVAVLDGDAVGQWQDQAASADHVAQGTADNKPTLQLNEMKGKPVIRFDGTNDHLVGAFTTGGAMSSPLIVFAVARLGAGLANNDAHMRMCDGDDATNRIILYKYATPSPDAWAINGGALLPGLAADSNANIWTVLFNGASSQFWINGVSQASGDAGAPSPDGLTIGALVGGAAGWNGDIAEMILYDSNLSSADKNQVGKYLGKKYGITYTSIP